MIACQFNSIFDASGTIDVAGDADSFAHVTKNSLFSATNQTINFSKPGGNSFGTYVYGINNASVEFDGCTLTGAIAAGAPRSTTAPSSISTRHRQHDDEPVRPRHASTSRTAALSPTRCNRRSTTMSAPTWRRR